MNWSAIAILIGILLVGLFLLWIAVNFVFGIVGGVARSIGHQAEAGKIQAQFEAELDRLAQMHRGTTND